MPDHRLRPAYVAESRFVEAAFGTGPQPEQLGYQAALDAGMALTDLGASNAALPFFRRAAALRSTSLALTAIGRCLRDLGRLDEAERSYREALSAAGGDSGHALVGLIAVLCDQRRYDDALPLARRAAIDYPHSAPAQTVAARCLEEFAGVLGSSGRIPPAHLDTVRQPAAFLRRRARELEAEDAVEPFRRRRQRPFPLPAVYAPALAAELASLCEGARALGSNDGAGVPAEDGSASSGPGGRTIASTLRRLLRKLAGRGGNH